MDRLEIIQALMRIGLWLSQSDIRYKFVERQYLARAYRLRYAVSRLQMCGKILQRRDSFWCNVGFERSFHAWVLVSISGTLSSMTCARF